MESEIKIKPGGNSRIFSYLISLSGYKIVIVMFIGFVFALIPILLTFIDGTFNQAGLKGNVINDYANVLLYLLGFPLGILILTLYSSKFPKALLQLKENKIINIDEENWDKFIKRTNAIYSKWYYKKAPYFVSIVATLFLIWTYRHPHNDIWYSLKTEQHFYYAAWAQLAVYYVTFYTFALGILNITASFQVLDLLFKKNNIIVQPLHPDNCGGLAPVGALSRTLNIGILFIGVITALNIYNNYVLYGRPLFDYLQITIIIVYFASAYIVFFFPMLAAHKPMKKAKRDEMNSINQYINEKIELLKLDLKNDNDINMQEMENLENARKIYDVTSKMPVYPYNLKTILSFITSITPLLIFILEQLIRK